MQKIYYSISEVSKMLGLAPHVLRYWETEFHELKPKKSRAGSRTYRESDINLLKEIQQLLHVERFTIEGTRLELSRRKAVSPAIEQAKVKAEEGLKTGEEEKPIIEEIKRELREILEILR